MPWRSQTGSRCCKAAVSYSAGHRRRYSAHPAAKSWRGSSDETLTSYLRTGSVGATGRSPLQKDGLADEGGNRLIQIDPSDYSLITGLSRPAMAGITSE